jgi:predicted ester cyclase
MSTEQNKALVRQMYGEFDRGDVEAFAVFLAPSLVAHVPGAPGRLDRDAFKHFGLMFKSAFPDGHHVFDEVIAEGDKVVTIGTFRGTHQGELQGIAPTGKQVTLPVMHMDRIKGGNIVEHRGIGNMIDLMQQLGAVPLPGHGGS